MEIWESFPSKPSSLDTLLFDLDGTLVSMDRKGVELGFMMRALLRFSRAIAPWRFKQVFWTAAERMQNHGSDDYNFDVLVRELAAKSRWSESRMRREVHALLREDFPALEDRFAPIEYAHETLLAARARGYRVVLATNPVWPLLGVQMRLSWGGLQDFEFDFITHAENSKRCKPNPEYYQRLVDELDLVPEKCLMVGNDPRKDLPAAEVGIATFLCSDGQEVKDPRMSGRGRLQDLHNWITRSETDAA